MSEDPISDLDQARHYLIGALCFPGNQATGYPLLTSNDAKAIGAGIEALIRAVVKDELAKAKGPLDSFVPIVSVLGQPNPSGGVYGVAGFSPRQGRCHHGVSDKNICDKCD